MATHAKDEEIACLPDDCVLEFFVVDLCKKLVGEGQIQGDVPNELIYDSDSSSICKTIDE